MTISHRRRFYRAKHILNVNEIAYCRRAKCAFWNVSRSTLIELDFDVGGHYQLLLRRVWRVLGTRNSILRPYPKYVKSSSILQSTVLHPLLFTRL